MFHVLWNSFCQRSYLVTWLQDLSNSTFWIWSLLVGKYVHTLESKFSKTYWACLDDLITSYPGRRQYSGNTRWVFPQRCNVLDIQGTCREHFKGKDFLKSSRWKSRFKVYDMITSNVDLLANSSNHEVMFPEYSRDIPRMSVSKTFQEYPRNIVKQWKYF